MNHAQIALVKNSFEAIRPISEVSDATAMMFYDRLFVLDPSLRPLFKGDIKQQGRKLMQMLSVVVDGLEDPKTLISEVQDLGERHVAYGVENSHYDTVAAALLWTLEQGLGDGFTPEVREAWTAAYLLLAGIMKEAAAQISKS